MLEEVSLVLYKSFGTRLHMIMGNIAASQLQGLQGSVLRSAKCAAFSFIPGL